jgi:hypothetical protein
MEKFITIGTELKLRKNLGDQFEVVGPPKTNLRIAKLHDY